MSAVDDAKTIIQLFAGKVLDNQTMLRVAERVIATQSTFQNPWDEELNPDEYAAWPTAEEKAIFFIGVGNSYYRSLLFRAGKAEAEAANVASENAAGQDAANEIYAANLSNCTVLHKSVDTDQLISLIENIAA